MHELDREQAKAFTARLAKLDADSPRSWGRLTHDELVPHLIGAFKYSMGTLEGSVPAFRGNWFTTAILPKIALSGLMLPPRNIKTYNADGRAEPAVTSPGDLHDLAALMGDFIAGLESGNMKTAPHMIFGDIGPRGWAKFHVIHLRHHCKQFGL